MKITNLTELSMAMYEGYISRSQHAAIYTKVRKELEKVKSEGYPEEVLFRAEEGLVKHYLEISQSQRKSSSEKTSSDEEVDFYTSDVSLPDLKVLFSGYGIDTTMDVLDYDIVVVSYQDTEWKLTWSHKYSYYSGKIAGIEGFVL